MPKTVDSPRPGALADLLGGEERLEDLLDDLRRHAGAGIGHLDHHVIGRRHGAHVEPLRLGGRDVRGADRELAAARHGVAGIDREVHHHLLELVHVRLHEPEVAAVVEIELPRARRGGA